jgi:hypothetical protein
VGVERFANSEDFLEHLNFVLSEKPNTRGQYELIPADPGKVNPNKLRMGLQMAMDEEEEFLRAKQADPAAVRQLHGWVDVDGVSVPRNTAEYARALELADSLSGTSRGKLIGGFGGERGKTPTGETARDLAASALYNASYGIDTLTGSPLDYKQNAGHLFAFAGHGQGPTRAEQARVNKVTRAAEGMEKLNLLQDTLEDLSTAELYARHPEEMEQLLSELPSKGARTGWNPELKAMRSNAKRWHLN